MFVNTLRIIFLTVLLSSFVGFSESAYSSTINHFAVGKSKFWKQISATETEFSDYAFHAHVDGNPYDGEDLTAVTLNSTIALSEGSPDNFSFNHEDISTIDALNLLYPDGNYEFKFEFAELPTEYRNVFLSGSFPSQVPLINNHLPGDTLGLTPTFCWNQWQSPPDPSEDVSGIIFQIFKDLGAGDDEMVYGQSFTNATTELTIPLGILETGSHYELAVGFNCVTEQGVGMDSFHTSTEFACHYPPPSSFSVLACLVLQDSKGNSGRVDKEKWGLSLTWDKLII